MKVHAMQLKIIVITLFMVLVQPLCVAAEQETLSSQDYPVALIEGEAERISDEGLLSIRGLGDEGARITVPRQISVILWDEIGGSTRTRHEESSGSGNTQNVNLILINVNTAR